MAPFVLAADIGASFIRMAAVGPAAVSRVIERPTPTRDVDVFVATLAGLAAELEGAAAPGLPLCLAIAGLCDPVAGTVEAANIPGLAGQPLAALVERRIGRAVRLVNDADAFALAEAEAGAGRGHAVVLGAIIGSGIGGGVVADGAIVRGAGGAGGEWGHGPVARELPVALGRPLPRMRCGCGCKGCADTFGGARGLERLHAAIGHGASDSREIVAAWRAGEAAAAETVAVWAELLAEPLALAVNITGASAVVTGGGLGRDAALMAALSRALVPQVLRGGLVLTPGALPNAALVGAAMLARQP